MTTRRELKKETSQLGYSRYQKRRQERLQSWTSRPAPVRARPTATPVKRPRAA